MAHGEDLRAHAWEGVTLHRVPDHLGKRVTANNLSAVQIIQWHEFSRLQVSDEQHTTRTDDEHDARLQLRKTHWQHEITLRQRCTGSHVNCIPRVRWE